MDQRWQSIGPATLAIALVVAIASVGGTVGADARWLGALGSDVVRTHGVPDGVPYATAASAGWPNVPVAAEVVFHWLFAGLGDRGALLAQLVAVAVAFTMLALAARRRGAQPGSVGVVLLVVGIGALPALLVVRVQLFSLPLFALLLALLQSEARSPSQRIWLLAPLVAVWSNLHGAVLAGFAVAAAYLVLERARVQPLLSAAVLATSAIAVCATPALWRTPEYYFGVLESEAARRGEGLWAPLSLHSGFDLVFLAAAALLVALALRSRPAVWELAAAAGLAVITVRNARTGVWLLFVLAIPAARGLRLEGRARRPLAIAVLSVATLGAVLGVVRGPIAIGASGQTIDETVRRAHGTPVLADGLLAEQLVLAGGRVWIANPLDAFSRRDQRVYLDWLDGRPAGDVALAHAPRVVLVQAGGDADRRIRDSPARPRLREVARDGNAVLYAVR